MIKQRHSVKRFLTVETNLIQIGQMFKKLRYYSHYLVIKKHISEQRVKVLRGR